MGRLVLTPEGLPRSAFVQLLRAFYLDVRFLLRKIAHLVRTKRTARSGSARTVISSEYFDHRLGSQSAVQVIANMRFPCVADVVFKRHSCSLLHDHIDTADKARSIAGVPMAFASSKTGSATAKTTAVTGLMRATAPRPLNRYVTQSTCSRLGDCLVLSSYPISRFGVSKWMRP